MSGSGIYVVHQLSTNCAVLGGTGQHNRKGSKRKYGEFLDSAILGGTHRTVIGRFPLSHQCDVSPIKPRGLGSAMALALDHQEIPIHGCDVAFQISMNIDVTNAH
jgi:hypothetical protein